MPLLVLYCSILVLVTHRLWAITSASYVIFCRSWPDGIADLRKDTIAAPQMDGSTARSGTGAVESDPNAEMARIIASAFSESCPVKAAVSGVGGKIDRISAPVHGSNNRNL